MTSAFQKNFKKFSPNNVCRIEMTQIGLQTAHIQLSTLFLIAYLRPLEVATYYFVS